MTILIVGAVVLFVISSLISFENYEESEKAFDSRYCGTIKGFEAKIAESEDRKAIAKFFDWLATLSGVVFVGACLWLYFYPESPIIDYSQFPKFGEK